MAGFGDSADREHSRHYLVAVASVAIVMAGLAWLSQNGTLAAAAAAIGFYALHLFSIRFLLENQKRQQRVLDAQWEVLQRFIGPDDGASGEHGEDLVPAMPNDREASEWASNGGGHVVPPFEAFDDLPREGAGPRREPVVDEAEAVARGSRAVGAEVPVPRHFALGTVALVRNLLSPAEVARILLEQRMQPGKKFGALAVELGLLSESQREELLLAQQEGLFTDVEMREARQRLRAFRESAAHSMAGLE